METALTRAKLSAGAALFRLARIDRLHIIGCARSGTTFMQYCMLAYEGIRVENAETSPHYPGLQGKLSLARRASGTGGFHYITKRTYGWFEDPHIAELLDAVRRYDAGLLLMIRDPRAVLVSRHRRAGNGTQPYVEEDRWLRSILAGERIWRHLEGYRRKCVIRYEDLIAHPGVVDERIQRVFGLRRRAEVRSINAARTNAELIGYRVSREQRDAMHGLKDADPTRLEQQPADVELQSAAARQKYLEYVSRYDAGDDFADLLQAASPGPAS